MRALVCVTELAINPPISLYYMVYILLHYITGPVHNIMVNDKEVMRVLVCATELVLNHPFYIILHDIT